MGIVLLSKGSVMIIALPWMEKTFVFLKKGKKGLIFQLI